MNRLIMTVTPVLLPLRQFLQEYSDQKHHIDKGFQRNLVWGASDKSSYIQSVVDGNASSAIIVSDLRSSLEASKIQGEFAAVETLAKLIEEGKTSMSLDGMQRRDTLLAYCNNKIALDIDLYDDDTGAVYNCKGRFFKDVPPNFRSCFMSRPILVVTHNNVPYSKCSKIFRKLNSGSALNAQEMRTAIKTPMSPYVRNLAEVTHEKRWCQIQGFDEKKISRMANSETLAHMFMHTLPGVRGKDFDNVSTNRFYEYGEDKFTFENVPEYKNLENSRHIIEETMKCYEHGYPTSKNKIASKTMWVILYACEHIYNSGGQIQNYGEFYETVRNTDIKLEAESRAKMSSDILAATTHPTSPISDVEASKMYPAENYYWKWIHRNGSHKWRKKRIETLIRRLEGLCDDCVFFPSEQLVRAS